MDALATNKPSSAYIKALVYDYLYHAGYVKTAKTFRGGAGEAVGGVDVGADADAPDSFFGWSEPELLRHAVQRREIETHILSGRIASARQLLNDYFPLVLQPTSPVPPQNTPLKFPYGPSESVNPLHLTLNLRIHEFIESFRTEPLLYPPPPPPPPTMAYTPTNLKPPTSTSSSSAHTPLHARNPSSDERLLIEAQRLYSEIGQLADEHDRQKYQLEMQQVGGLLAYNCPEKSPMAKYLSQERRQKLAMQINSAILYRLALPPIPKLETIARQTAAVFTALHDQGVELPPESKRPPGIPIPLHGGAAPLPTKKGDKLEDPVDHPLLVQRFHFGKFVASSA